MAIHFTFDTMPGTRHNNYLHGNIVATALHKKYQRLRQEARDIATSHWYVPIQKRTWFRFKMMQVKAAKELWRQCCAWDF